MGLPPFQAKDCLEMSDYDLGGYLLGYFIATQADDLGIPIDRIPADFAERVRQHVLTLESATAKNAAVEKALHKAASGDFEAAGKLFREYLRDGTVSLKLGRIAIKFIQGRKRGTGGPIRKAIAKLLVKNSETKNPELWTAISKNLPKGWQAFDTNNLGKYLEGPNMQNMGYARFCTVCSEERKKIK